MRTTRAPGSKGGCNKGGDPCNDPSDEILHKLIMGTLVNLLPIHEVIVILRREEQGSGTLFIAFARFSAAPHLAKARRSNRLRK